MVGADLANGTEHCGRMGCRRSVRRAVEAPGNANSLVPINVLGGKPMNMTVPTGRQLVDEKARQIADARRVDESRPTQELQVRDPSLRRHRS